VVRTTVNIDETLLAEAKGALGTEGLTETINAAMAEVARRRRLNDFSVRDFDITDVELADARRDRPVIDG